MLGMLVRCSTLALFLTACSHTTSGPSSIHPDPQHGIEWQVEAPGGHRPWAEARQYCAALELAGPGWRLPTEIELGRLYHAKEAEWEVYRGWREYKEPPTERNTEAGGVFWTSATGAQCGGDTPPPTGETWAWAVRFEHRENKRGLAECFIATDHARVRCVRDLSKQGGAR
jgi:hypothetical protein